MLPPDITSQVPLDLFGLATGLPPHTEMIPPEDAIYLNCSTDGVGQPLNGSNRYRVHFDKGSVPPVTAFWSFTASILEGYFIENPTNRYAFGDRDPLKINPEGSLDIYIRAQTPDPDRVSNWPPSGEGPFNLTIRLYWPQDAILSGTWHTPVPERIP